MWCIDKCVVLYKIKNIFEKLKDNNNKHCLKRALQYERDHFKKETAHTAKSVFYLSFSRCCQYGHSAKIIDNLQKAVK